MNIIVAKQGVRKYSTVFVRTFSTQDQGSSSQEKLESMFDSFLKRVEVIQEEYFTSDTEKTVEEAHQEVLRSAYLSRYAMDQTLEKISIFSNAFTAKREELDILKGSIETKSLNKLEKLLPDNKTRPSLLQPVCHGLALVGALATPFLGEERSFKVLKTMEDAIQDEHDSMLRSLNKHKIEDKKTRSILVQTRDAGYDFFDENFPELKDNSKDTDFDKNLQTATKAFTRGFIRLSRYI
ncbi:unnamed protein product [Moneuplotes crassus]|uniref:Uncharacterized protein n=1 Tax=Euplotes crassus TaxID=5936 RepID=A0AAD2D4A8_EUPCR|nr:unnamed protein product [Moneuplotes crassus]